MDEGKANGVDGDADSARTRHVIDWLEQASDLPHLIARVSELVLRLGQRPEDLVVLPRAELDRRELAAYSAGWADVVDERLPAVRDAYEQRITAAYLQGQEDARTGRRPRRTRRSEGERGQRDGGGEVIQLPYVDLLRPPPEWTRVEQRGEQERSLADGTDGTDGTDKAEGTEGAESVVDGPGGDTLLSAREVREKRVAPPAHERRPVVRRNGRPSVPPLTRKDKERRAVPSEERPAQGQRARLSDKARALADELEGRAPGRRLDE